MWSFNRKHPEALRPMEACHCIGACMKCYLGWDNCPEGRQYFCLVDAGLVPTSASTATTLGELLEDREHD